MHFSPLKSIPLDEVHDPLFGMNVSPSYSREELKNRYTSLADPSYVPIVLVDEKMRLLEGRLNLCAASAKGLRHVFAIVVTGLDEEKYSPWTRAEKVELRRHRLAKLRTAQVV